MEATEKLQAALLNSISHDLRTPLVTITGALSSLEEGPLLDDEIRRNLIETAREEADRLNRLVGNLLNMTRLEAGAMRVHPEACDVQDLIGSVLGAIRHSSRKQASEDRDSLPIATNTLRFCFDRSGISQCDR